jgi:hypothetical protein
VTAFMFKILVVVYGKDAKDSKALMSLIEVALLRDDLCLEIWNNDATRIILPSDLPNFKGHLAINNSGENTALSEVYSAFVKKHSSSDVLIFSDDDSFYNEEYFQSIEECMSVGADVVVPKISGCGDYLHSPRLAPIVETMFNKNATIRLHDTFCGPIKSKNFFAITSGMACRHKVFDDVFFDRKLFLYGIDSQFFYDLASINKYNITVMNYFLKHDLSYKSFDESIRMVFWRNLQRWQAARHLGGHAAANSFLIEVHFLVKTVFLIPFFLGKKLVFNVKKNIG